MKLSPELSMTECNQRGRIHSTESFGTVDGPGIRFVVFFQGCPMRCLYCHNPDTWDMTGGKERSVEELLAEYEKNRNFYRRGGLTATGGEPLMQLKFLTDLFEEAKKRKIHTCLDTSGIVYRESRKKEFERLFESTDLVLLDMKHSDAKGHRELTGQQQKPVLEFARALETAGVPMIVRHVIVPGITDQKEELEKLGQLLGTFQNLKGLEVLPYHTMGVNKYKQLNLEYPLENLESLPAEKAKEARQIILQNIRKNR